MMALSTQNSSPNSSQTHSPTNQTHPQIFNFSEENFLDENTQVPNLDHMYQTPIQEINYNLKDYKNILNVTHINAVSIPKHRVEIHRILNETKMDIMGVSETNIKQNTPSDVYAIDNYNFYQKTRDHKDRGGVGIYVRDCYKVKPIPIQCDFLNPEIMFIEIMVNNIKIAVGVVYKPPSISYGVFAEIQEILAFITTNYSHVIILGDFNVDQLLPETDKYKYLLNNIINPFELTQIIQSPTRITTKTSTLIDLILVNNAGNVKFSGVVDIPGISDHCLVYMAYALKKPKQEARMITRRDFRKFCEVDFKRDMEFAPWGNIYSVAEDDIDNQVTILENIFTDIIDKNAPFRTFRVTKPPAPWLTEEIKSLMDLRDRYKNKYNKDKKETTHNTYKELRNQVTHTIRKVKIKTFNEMINSKSSNSKEFHKELKRHNVVNSKQDKNMKCSWDPNTLNKTFVKNNNEAVDETALYQVIEEITNTNCFPKFEFKEVSEEEVKKAVKAIKTNACGVDNISAYFIKLSIEYSVHAITEIINASFKHNYFPERWKKARIKPIPKTTSPASPTDYRPISLLLAFSKIMEKLVVQQMTKYMKIENKLDEYQSAYKTYHSTTTALLDITDNIYKGMDNSELTLLVLLDYSKAFDCANHKLILAKLKAIGFMESSLLWIKSYLADRKQQVITDKGISEWICLSNGVPQGSILGPLLFTVLVADLHKIINHCKYHMYADDTQIYCHGKPQNIDEMMQNINSDLANIAEFSKKNCLKLNSSKSNYIMIGSQQSLNKIVNNPNLSINMSGKEITRNTQVRNLGVIFDETLSWNKHVNTLITAAYGKIKQIYRHRNFLTTKTRIAICESYILSHFNYCDLIIQNITGELGRKIQKVQNTCTRFIFGLKKYDHISSSFIRLKTLNMENRRLMHSITLMHKIEKKLAPKYLCDKISHSEDIHSHNTRGKHKIRIPKSRTVKNQNAFIQRTSNRYNEILMQCGLTTDTSVATFKKRCKEFILQTYPNGV